MEYTQDISELVKSFNKEAETYENDTDTLHHKVQEYVILKNIENELNGNKNIKILDSGGGIGKFAIVLAKKGYNVVLSDISEKSLEIAKKKMNDANVQFSIVYGNAEKTNFNDSEFDFVMMNGGVISYSPDPEKCIIEANRILRKKGILWFDYFNTLGWSIELDNVKMQTTLADKDEYLIKMDDWDYAARVFSIRYIEKMLKRNGFLVKKEMGLMGIMHALPLDIRYSNEYTPEILKKYMEIEYELSNRPECVGNSWSCIVCAEKTD
jgi:ubiquinone/menaquinone biosynthesis C-methylase UbiE